VALCGCAAKHEARVADFEIPRFTRTLSQWLNLLLNFLHIRVRKPGQAAVLPAKGGEQGAAATPNRDWSAFSHSLEEWLGQKD